MKSITLIVFLCTIGIILWWCTRPDNTSTANTSTLSWVAITINNDCKAMRREQQEASLSCRKNGWDDASCHGSSINEEYLRIQKKHNIADHDMSEDKWKCVDTLEYLYQISVTCMRWNFIDNNLSINQKTINMIQCWLDYSSGDALIDTKTIVQSFQNIYPGRCTRASECPEQEICNVNTTSRCEKASARLLDAKEIESLVKNHELASQWCSHAGQCTITDTSWESFAYKDTIDIDKTLNKYNKTIEKRRTE